MSRLQQQGQQAVNNNNNNSSNTSTTSCVSNNSPAAAAASKRAGKDILEEENSRRKRRRLITDRKAMDDLLDEEEEEEEEVRKLLAMFGSEAVRQHRLRMEEIKTLIQESQSRNVGYKPETAPLWHSASIVHDRRPSGRQWNRTIRVGQEFQATLPEISRVTAPVEPALPR